MNIPLIVTWMKMEVKLRSFHQIYYGMVEFAFRIESNKVVVSDLLEISLQVWTNCAKSAWPFYYVQKKKPLDLQISS